MLTRSIAEVISRSLVRGSMHDGESASIVTRWLVADREFNSWFLSEVKKSDDDEKVLSVVTAYGEDQERIEKAWDTYRREQELEAFVATLQASLGRMSQIRASFSK